MWWRWGKPRDFPLAGYFMLLYSTVYKLAAYFSGFRLLGSSIANSPTITCLTMGYRKLRSVDFNSLNTSVAVCKLLFNHGDNWINYKTTYWFYICTFSTIEKYAIISNCTLIWSAHVSNLTNHIIAFNYSVRSALPTIIKNGYCYPSCRYLLSLLAVATCCRCKSNWTLETNENAP